MKLSHTTETNRRTQNCIVDDLVDKYGQAVYKFCRSLTYTKEDADDLFQETFIKAFGQLSKVCDHGNPQGFLFSVAMYQWKSWKRKYARQNRIAPTTPLDDAVVSEINIEGVVITKEETHLVRMLVAGLPEKYRVPVVMFYTAELGVADIAFALNIPVGTVKSRLHKARSLIEKGLIKNGYEK